MSFIKNKLFFFLISCSVLAIPACTKKLNTNTEDPNGLGIPQISGKDVFAQALLTTVTNKVGANISAFPGDNYDTRSNGWVTFQEIMGIQPAVCRNR